MKFITDTNVWYDIAEGIRDPIALKKGGNSLHATPISLLEIASPIDNRTFSKRKFAAQAVIDHADSVVVDCETHLVQQCGLSIPYQPVAWIEAFRAIAQSTSEGHLTKGVDDFRAGVTRGVNMALVRSWREYNYTDFKMKVINAIDKYVPGYKQARANNTVKYLTGQNKTDFIDVMRSTECQNALFMGVFWRALEVLNQPQREPTSSEFAIVRIAFTPYVAAYTEYVIRCATLFAPQTNDFGDSECFLYLQDDRRFLSSDRHWVEIARSACPGFICDPENKVP